MLDEMKVMGCVFVLTEILTQTLLFSSASL